MQKWYAEDWEFEITVLEGTANHCRLGIEKGDKFVFRYETPANFCPRTMLELYTWCEIIRCGGDFTLRGSKEEYEMTFWCPCRCIHFKLRAIPINRDENGNYIGVHKNVIKR